MRMLEFTKKIKLALAVAFMISAPMLISVGFEVVDVPYIRFVDEQGILRIENIVFFTEDFYHFLMIKANVLLTYFVPVFSGMTLIQLFLRKEPSEVLRRGLLRLNPNSFKREMKRLSKLLAKQFGYSPASRLAIQKSIPVPTSLEPQNFLFLGQAGSGKTQAILDFTEQIKGFEETMIFYDRKPDFFPKYFRQEIDLIYYPKDKRSINFQPLREVKQESIEEDVDFIVSSLIVDENKNDSHWNEQARGAMKAILLTVYHTTSGTNTELMDFLQQNQGVERIKEVIVEAKIAYKYGIDITGILTDDGQGTSVYATLNKYLTHLRRRDFYSDVDNFSLHEFVQSTLHENIDQRLFVVQTTQEQESYSTWYRLFFTMLSREIRSLPNRLDRRIWLILDEFQSLGKMPELVEELPAEGRSKGASMLLATQSLAKLKSLYGDEGTQSILANIKTKFVFALGDPYSQKQMEEYFGKIEVVESKESYSTGRELTSDRMNKSTNTHNKSVIMASEIGSLRPLRAFVQIFEYVTEVTFRPIKISDREDFLFKTDDPEEEDSISPEQIKHWRDFLDLQYSAKAEKRATENIALEKAWRNASSDKERAKLYEKHQKKLNQAFSFEVI